MNQIFRVIWNHATQSWVAFLNWPQQKAKLNQKQFQN